MNTHLVFDTPAIDAIALTQAAVFVHQNLWHDEQAHAFDAGRGIRQPREHQMDDVACDVMLARADENFVTRDFVCAVSLRLGFGAHQSKVSAAMWLGQAHRASPLTAGHFVQVRLFLLVCAMGVQRGMGAMGQTGIHRPGLVGAVEHFVEALVDNQWQPLTSKRRITAERGPASLDIFGIRLFETFRCCDGMGDWIQFATLLVSADIQRKRHFRRKLSALFQNGVDRVRVDIRIGIFWDGLKLLLNVEHFIQDELHVAQWGGIRGHGGFPFYETRIENAVNRSDRAQFGFAACFWACGICRGCTVALKNALKAFERSIYRSR